jgi:collagen type III alpha
LPKGSLENGIEFEAHATLAPEPRNRHDRNAVAVMVQGRLVGYLPKEQAPRYQPALIRLIDQGLSPVVPCRIWAREVERIDWDDRGRSASRRTLYSRVSLDLGEPHMMAPLNLPPTHCYGELPKGSAVQVTGEEQHMTELGPWLRPEGEAWVYATLHEVTVATARMTKSIVEVRIDGLPVGVLTPKMSSEYLPAIQHLESAEAVVMARAIVKGNRLKAEVVLYAQRAHELSGDWIDRFDGGKRDRPAAPESRADDAARLVTTIPQATAWRFNPPPGWPPAPEGWIPPTGWQPPADWPAAPDGWQFWI